MKPCICVQKIIAALFITVLGVLALSTPLEAAISLSGGLAPSGNSSHNPTMTVTAPDTISISEMGRDITLTGFTASAGGTYSTGQAIGGSNMGGIFFSGATVAATPGDPANWSACMAIYVPAGNNNQLCCWYDDLDAVYYNHCVTFTETAPVNSTVAGTASAANDGTAITVTMPYNGDLNASNTFTVEYKLSSDSLWKAWVTAAAHVPTPYTTAITGLAQGVAYDVRLTYSDTDGVFGIVQQLVSGITGVTNQLNVTNLFVTEGAAADTILVVANFSGDANSNGAMTIQYKRSADSFWTAGPNAAKKTGRMYATITGITYDTNYEVQVVFNDPDGLAGSSLVTKSLTPRAYKASPMLHNSLNANTVRGPKWSGDPVYADGWGLPGTRYGTMSCSSCHSQPTSNIGMVVTAISDAEAKNYAKNPVKYRGQGSNNTLGNDLGRDAAVRRICEVCHTKTRVHRNDPSGQSWTSHQNNTGCLSCHPHDSGFQNRCYECHAGPGASPAAAYGIIP